MRASFAELTRSERFGARGSRCSRSSVSNPDELIECGEYVVVPNVTRMRGRDGIEVEARSASVVTLREGRIVAWRLFRDRAEALRAVGLPG